ncbi:Ribosome biogenesis protein BOP1-like protein [Drosera capensis]
MGVEEQQREGGRRRRKKAPSKEQAVAKEALEEENLAGTPEAAEDEGHVSSMVDEASDADDAHEAGEESDSSEDEVSPRNTIGDVPLEWYKDEEHVGHDISGKKIKKKEMQDKLTMFLDQNWSKLYDDYNDEPVELQKNQIQLIRRLLTGRTPHAELNSYEPSVDWFKWEYSIHPLSNAPEPKRRFTPSKWERKKKTHYDLWGSDASSLEKTRGLPYIPPPKPKLPGHEEAYNPSPEYIPSQEEINSFQLLYEEDRPKFIPQRHVPAWVNATKESFDRHLDLYLCARVRKKRINIDPESLKPKLPSRKDLRPYPTTCYIEYRGHQGAVTSISTEASGQWIASGSTDATVRIWEVATGRCIRVWQVGAAVQHVAWNPLLQLPILAVSVAHKKDITGVAYHRSYPLFATCSDDCTAYVFHGMVYSDLNQNPLIVPLDILKGHSSTNGRGILDCKFHPRQPWLFTAGANSLIKLFCH